MGQGMWRMLSSVGARRRPEKRLAPEHSRAAGSALLGSLPLCEASSQLMPHVGGYNSYEAGRAGSPIMNIKMKKLTFREVKSSARVT